MPTTVFYPPLSSLVQLDFLPEQLGFINTGLSSLLDDLYYRDLQVSKSARGDGAFYSLSIMSKKRLQFELPGTGIYLVLNPSHVSGSFSEFPIKLNYEWPILAYLKRFDLSGFAFTPAAFYDLALQILNISEAELINRTLGIFISAPTPINQFVDDVNSFYGTTIPYPSGPHPIQEVVNAIKNQPSLQGAAVAVFAIYLLDAIDEGKTLEKMDQFFSSLFVVPTKEYLINLVTPRINASLSLSVGIEFPRNILTPLTAPLHLGGVPLAPAERSMLIFNSVSGETFNFSTEYGIGYDTSISANLNHPSQIGNTPLGIAITGAKLDISRTTNIPEATLDGRPDDFMGVYIEYCAISLPSFIKDDTANVNPVGIGIVGRNLLIGTGGLSGTIGLETTGPGLYKKFGDHLQVGFTAFDIRFHQNAIVESNVKGYLIIPGFKDSLGNDAKIDILAHFGTDGDFSVTASENQGITLIKVPNIFSVDLKSVTVGRKDDRFYIAVSGSISFEDMGPPIGQFLPDKFEITKLVIWEDGKIEFEGGKITLPKAISLKVGPVELSVTAIGLGSHEQMHGGVMRQYKYFVFDGGIDTGPGGVDVSGKGIAFYYTVDNDPLPLHFFVRIQSIAIDIIIPGSAKPAEAALLLKGFLSMKEPENGGEGTEYIGGVEFTLPKLKMGGSAAMRMNPKVPAWIIDVGLELSTPIVLGSTGLGIYGFRGLVGQRYVATKNAVGLPDDAPWWQYYKAKVADSYKEGIDVFKFEQTDGFSLGAGVSLATVPDAGKTFSSKIFFLLSLPEVFLLQGQGQILKERIGLDTTTDPPFFALLAISSTSIEAAFGVNYKVPDDGGNPGSIVTVNALIEMGFFWGNAGAWYVNLGKDQPDDRRISVRLLTLFDAYFYMMLSSSGIRAGAGASYELKKKFGPLRAELYAYLDVAGKISFKPKQIGASIQIGGGVGLYIFGFGFSLSVHAGLAAEAPKPFIVSGELKACIRVLRKDRCAKFNFTWTFNSNLDLGEIKLLTEATADAAKAINIQTKESYALFGGTSVPTLAQLNNYYIPADSFIDLEFVNGVKPSAQVMGKYGGNTMGSEYINFVAPQRGKSDRVRHEYELESVKIKYHDGSSWVDFDVYAAATPLVLAPFVTTNLATLPFGYWQYQTPNLHNKLRILGQSPIEYVSQGSGGLVLEDSNITGESIFCGPDPIAKTCTTFENLTPNLGVLNGEPLLPADTLFFHQQAIFHLENGDGIVTAKPYQNWTHAICFQNQTKLVIDLVGPMVCVFVHLYASQATATVTFYERVILTGLDPSGLPLYDYVAVTSTIVQPNQGLLVVYDDINLAVERVVIESGRCENQPYYSNGGGSTNRIGNSAIPLADGEEKQVFRSIDAGKRQVNVPNTSNEKLNLASTGLNALAPLLGTTGCDLTEEAKQLITFVNTVISRREHQMPSFSVWPGDAGAYNMVFYNSVLYGSPTTGSSIQAKNVYTGSIWEIQITGPENFFCSLQFAPPAGVTMGPNDWFWLTRMSNPRCDPDNNSLGQNFSFLVDAYFQNPANGQITMLTLTLTSCYPSCDCKDACGVYVFQLCTLPYESAAYNNTLPSLPAVQNEIQTMINAFESSIRPIWRFDTAYYVEVKTKDTLYRESGSSVLASFPKTYYFGFRTAGPPGHFHEYLNPAGTNTVRADYQALVLKDRQDEFKLSKLLHYIDLTKSYPNADGQLLNAKPLFYLQPKLNVFWLQSYVYEFYRDWNSPGGSLQALNIELEALVKDPAPNPNVAALSPVAASWVLNSLPIISEDVQILNNMIINGNNPCAPTATIHPLAVNSEFTLPNLEPLKLYTTIFNSKFKRASMLDSIVREVHRFGFQTSRYGNFNEQIQSYLLVENANVGAATLEAKFTVEQAFDNATQILVAKSILDPTDPMPKDDLMRQTFGHPFNRLVEGALKLDSIHPPQSTEVNIIKDSNTSKIIGLLVKNPEPFNDPKIPLSTIATSVRMTVNGGPDSDYLGLFAKDYAQVFLSNSDLSMSIPASSTISLSFDYMQYNGATYVVIATETLTVQLP